MKNMNQEKIQKKAKKIRSTIMMLLLCILLMSAATYAWFTLSNTAKVSNLTMTVGDVTGLQIADDTGSASTKPANNAWKQATTAVTFKGKLLPATTTNGTSFLKPVYNENGDVSGTDGTTASLNKDTENTNQEGYYIEFYFWLKAMGKAGETTTVKLDKGTGLNSGIYSDAQNPSGTYSLSKENGVSDVLPSAAVRMSLVNGEAVKVFEPNSNFNTSADQKATDSRSSKDAKASDIQQNMDGTFGAGNAGTSDAVLTLQNNEATRITLYLWIEGTDAQCGNEIAAKDIISQLKFVTAN